MLFFFRGLLVRADAATLADLQGHRAADDVAGGEVLVFMFYIYVYIYIYTHIYIYIMYTDI